MKVVEDGASFWSWSKRAFTQEETHLVEVHLRRLPHTNSFVADLAGEARHIFRSLLL
jgi:hypothetical protein